MAPAAAAPGPGGRLHPRNAGPRDPAQLLGGGGDAGPASEECRARRRRAPARSPGSPNSGSSDQSRAPGGQHGRRDPPSGSSQQVRGPGEDLPHGVPILRPARMTEQKTVKGAPTRVRRSSSRSTTRSSTRSSPTTRRTSARAARSSRRRSRCRSARASSSSSPCRSREAPFELLGEVVWSKADGEEPGMGIRFIYADDSQRVDFEGVVERLMSDSLGPS